MCHISPSAFTSIIIQPPFFDPPPNPFTRQRQVLLLTHLARLKTVKIKDQIVYSIVPGQ